MSLEMTQHQYKLAVISFAKDLRLASTYNRSHPTRWVETGLLESPNDLQQLLLWIDDVLTDDEEFEGSLAKAHNMHTRLLSYLKHLQDDVIIQRPDSLSPSTSNAAPEDAYIYE